MVSGPTSRAVGRSTLIEEEDDEIRVLSISPYQGGKKQGEHRVLVPPTF